ncbi:MAG: flagellar protein FlgN, partial [Planctomycetes bacterium]|nr:flagellar protein FlgN [Planctomycetota bacterium]
MNDDNAERPWDETIATLLEDLSDVQDRLLEVLAEKRHVMARGDLEGMARLQPLEQELCHRLQLCHDRRAALLHRATENGLPSGNLGELASAVNLRGERGLRRRVDHAATRMRLLQHHSLANWVLAQKALLHASQMLEIIATGGRFQPTYGKDGCAPARGALV